MNDRDSGLQVRSKIWLEMDGEPVFGQAGNRLFSGTRRICRGSLLPSSIRSFTQSDSAFFMPASFRAVSAFSLSAVFISFRSMVTLSILPVNLNGTL